MSAMMSVTPPASPPRLHPSLTQTGQHIYYSAFFFSSSSFLRLSSLLKMFSFFLRPRFLYCLFLFFLFFTLHFIIRLSVTPFLHNLSLSPLGPSEMCVLLLFFLLSRCLIDKHLKERKDERLHAGRVKLVCLPLTISSLSKPPPRLLGLSNHLPAIAVLPAPVSSSPCKPIGTRLLLLHLWMAVIGHIQHGVVVATVLHKVKFLGTKLRGRKRCCSVTGAPDLCTDM